VINTVLRKTVSVQFRCKVRIPLLLFLDEIAGDRDKALLSELVRKCRRKREQAMTFRVLTKLKLGYRTFDARSLVGGEDITPVVPRNQVGCRSIGIKVR
jgi:hypothetical protein